MLKAVLFDLDDTLLDWSGFKTDWSSMERKHVRLVFEYVSSAIQPLHDFDAYAAEFSNRMIAAWAAARGTMRAPNLGTVLVETSAAFGVPTDELDARTLLQAYGWGMIPGTRIFPDAPPMIRLLREQGLKVGIVTNAHQPMWVRDIEIQQHGIFDLFPTCRIAASDVGYLKPHPLIFQTALRCLDLQPNETVFVGDDPEADIIGAKKAGMFAVLRRLPHRPVDEDEYAPNAALDQLAELPSILDAHYPGWRKA